ncbi:exodeoxyribonuclease VII small subunit, partial [Lactiplantibacillus plantarum]
KTLTKMMNENGDEVPFEQADANE